MLTRVALLLIFSTLLNPVNSQTRAKEGLVDGRAIDFTSGRLSLQGEWLWVDGKLIMHRDLNSQNSLPVEFPKIWNDVRSGSVGQGVASYYLTVLLPSSSKKYALELPQMYSSYKLWANNKLVASNGNPGTDSKTTQSQWLPQTVAIEAEDTLNLVLQIANFDHDKGGCKESIYLGDQDTLIAKDRLSHISKIVECSSLFVIAATFLVIYLSGRRKKVIIYFALLCATWSVRSAFSNEYLAIRLMPDFDWVTMVKIEYITLYLTMIWAILFLSRLFNNESNHVVKYILVILNAVFVVFTLLNQPILFTKMLALYLVTSGILLVYAIVVIIRAYINERTGAAFLTVSTLLGILIFSYDIFTYEGIFSFNSILFSSAYLAMFIMLGLALMLHLNIIKSSKTSSSLSYKDLYGS